MLVIEVGVKFHTVTVKCTNIFDQDCRLGRGGYDQHEGITLFPLTYGIYVPDPLAAMHVNS
jgi:hypothetical protein